MSSHHLKFGFITAFVELFLPHQCNLPNEPQPGSSLRVISVLLSLFNIRDSHTTIWLHVTHTMKSNSHIYIPATHKQDHRADHFTWMNHHRIAQVPSAMCSRELEKFDAAEDTYQYSATTERGQTSQPHPTPEQTIESRRRSVYTYLGYILAATTNIQNLPPI